MTKSNGLRPKNFFLVLDGKYSTVDKIEPARRRQDLHPQKMQNNDSQTIEEVYGVDGMSCYECMRVLTAPSQVYMEPHPQRYEIPKCAQCYKLPPSPVSEEEEPVQVQTQLEIMVENEVPAEPTMSCFGCGTAMYEDEDGNYRAGYWCSRDCAYGDAHND